MKVISKKYKKVDDNLPTTLFYLVIQKLSMGCADFCTKLSAPIHELRIKLSGYEKYY